MSSFPARAALLSLFGALLGATLWVLIGIAADLERAIPALLVGTFAGTATRIEPRRGRPVQIVAVALTLIGLTVVQYLLVRHAISTDLIEQGTDRSIPMFLSPSSMWFVTFGWLRIYPVDIVFWALSAAAAWLLSASTSGIRHQASGIRHQASGIRGFHKLKPESEQSDRPRNI